MTTLGWCREIRNPSLPQLFHRWTGPGWRLRRTRWCTSHIPLHIINRICYKSSCANNSLSPSTGFLWLLLFKLFQKQAFLYFLRQWSNGCENKQNICFQNLLLCKRPQTKKCLSLHLVQCRKTISTLPALPTSPCHAPHPRKSYELCHRVDSSSTFQVTSSHEFFVLA